MTPENQILLSTKPNLGKRMLAGLIDYVLIFSYWGVMFYFFGEPNNEGGYTVSGLPGLSVMLCWLAMTVGMEQVMGATLGNKAMKLRPVPKYSPSEKLSLGQSLKRHLLDLFDLWPFGVLGILMIKNTKSNQRLGDLWAKTVVIDTSDPEQGSMQDLAS